MKLKRFFLCVASVVASFSGLYAQGRRVVLQPKVSLVSQVSRSNTTYVIQYDFDLSGEEILLPSGCTLVSEGGRIRNGKISFNGAELGGFDYVRFEDITITSSPSSSIVNAAWFGFTPSNPDMEILKNVIHYCKHVIIKDGEYNLGSSIIINSDDSVCELRGETRRYTKLLFNNVDGIILNKGVEMSNLYLAGRSCTGRWDESSKMYREGKKGISVSCGGQYLHQIDVYTFMVGLDISEGNVITGTFENITLAYNSDYGLFLKHDNKAQKNNLRFISLYCVKCGREADNLNAKSTGLNSGHGMYILGGYGNYFESCVTEYNTGCGLLIDMPTGQSPLLGNAFVCTYFERNKYANNYIRATSSPSQMNNLSFSSSFYSDAGLKPVSDACKSRTVILEGADFVVKGNPDSPSLFIDELEDFYGGIDTKTFFADYTRLSSQIIPKQFALCVHDKRTAILLNQDHKSIGANRWMTGQYLPGTYSVVLNAQNTGVQPVTLVIQIKSGDVLKPFSVRIVPSNNNDEYVLGTIQLLNEETVSMTGAYISSPKAGKFSVEISKLYVIKQ